MMAQFNTGCIKRNGPKPLCFGLNLLGRHKIEFRILINMILYEPWTCYTIDFYMFTRNPFHDGPPPTPSLIFTVRFVLEQFYHLYCASCKKLKTRFALPKVKLRSLR